MRPRKSGASLSRGKVVAFYLPVLCPLHKHSEPYGNTLKKQPSLERISGIFLHPNKHSDFILQYVAIYP